MNGMHAHGLRNGRKDRAYDDNRRNRVDEAPNKEEGERFEASDTGYPGSPFGHEGYDGLGDLIVGQNPSESGSRSDTEKGDGGEAGGLVENFAEFAEADRPVNKNPDQKGIQNGDDRGLGGSEEASHHPSDDDDRRHHGKGGSTKSYEELAEGGSGVNRILPESGIDRGGCHLGQSHHDPRNNAGQEQGADGNGHDAAPDYHQDAGRDNDPHDG